MTKLVFHLGDKKAGSTAIQTTLASRAWRCDGVKLSYPTDGRINHIHLAKALIRNRDGGFDGHRAFDDLAETIRAEQPDVAVISSEDFEDVAPDDLAAALHMHLPDLAPGARFISYVRPHAERVASSFAERIKAGSVSGTMEQLFDKFLREGTLDYTNRFLGWRRVFGDSFVLRPMIRDTLLGQDVVRDFLAFALGTEDFAIGPTPSANESVSLQDLIILRDYQAALRGTSRRRSEFQPAIGRDLARRMAELGMPDGTRVRMHRALAERVRDACAEDARALDAAFFAGQPMSQALDAAPGRAIETEQSLRIEDHFSPRECYLIGVFIGHAAALARAEPDVVAETLRAEHRDRIMRSETTAPAEDTDAAPRRGGRRLAKAKAGRKGKRFRAEA